MIDGRGDPPRVWLPVEPADEIPPEDAAAADIHPDVDFEKLERWCARG